jgi:hypothetical protein
VGARQVFDLPAQALHPTFSGLRPEKFAIRRDGKSRLAAHRRVKDLRDLPHENKSASPGCNFSCIPTSSWKADEVWTILIGGNTVTSMPTVLRIGPYRFFFYAGDRDEPQHVHVERDNQLAKFWLNPVTLQTSGGFSVTETNHIKKLVEENREVLFGGWNEFFNG